MLKGTATIELTDVKTGKKEIVKHDNMITNAISDILNTSPFGMHHRAVYDLNNLLPIVPNLIGGIFLYESPLEEDPSKYYAIQKLTGYSNNAVNSGADPMRGSMNQTESGKLEDGTGYRFVFDFGTSQGNGDISALGLTSRWAGSCGWGSTLIQSSRFVQLERVETELVEEYLQARAWICLTTIKDDGYMYAIWPYAKGASVYRYRWRYDALGMFDTVAVHKDRELFKTISFESFPAAAISSAGYFSFCDGGDGYIWGFQHSGNTDGNSSGNATVNWVKINTDDWTVEEGTWTLAAQIYRFGYYAVNTSNNTPKRTNHLLVKNGYLYCVKYDKTAIYKINLENPTDLIEIPCDGFTVSPAADQLGATSATSVDYGGCTFNSIGDLVYFTNGYILDDVAYRTYAPSYSTSNYQGNYGLGGCCAPNLRFGPFAFWPGTECWPYKDTASRTATLALLTPYLATINNLETPVTKTADKTMKITYILREE
ncbi:MAG: hypothetical protein IJZ39_04445 [Oscillospiraceae bacterium]|nr:hypothetical protein [Oscillospiraceae bacterium]